MRFDERFLDELKSRLRPSEVIGRSVKLKRQGREWVGLSPFTKEKSPSFFVNDDKGFFHDFSSGKHGDIISFLQETERLSFVEAIERLAAEAGMSLPTPDPQATQREQRRQGLQDWLELAARYFEAALRRPTGQAARDYLVRRGLPEDQWSRFGLGYAPGGRTALRDALVQRGAKPSELVEAGLLIQPDDGGQPYDRFRDRVIFPITDARGRVISFGGRALNPDDRAKYLNGPETTLFHKGAILYGLASARKLLNERPTQAPVVVEGYLDVIACQRAQIPAVASMGTALTEEQMALLWRLHASPIVCFDADAAGQRARARLVERALPLLKPDRTFVFASLEGGKDPDDIYREHGPAALEALIGQTRGLSEVVWEIGLSANAPLETPERQAGFKAWLRKAAATIADKDLSETYREFLIGKFYQLTRPSREEVRVAANVLNREKRAKRWEPYTQGSTPEGRAAAQRQAVAFNPVVAAVTRALIDNPGVLHDKAEMLQTQGLGSEQLDRLAADMVSIVMDMEGVDGALLRSRLEALGHGETLKAVTRDAQIAHAPFLDAGDSEGRNRLLAYAIDLLTEVFSLQRALDAMKTEDAFEMSSFVVLKGERDRLMREMASGAAWQSMPSERVLH